MSRSIDADAAIKKLGGEAIAKYPNTFTMGLLAAVREIDDMPTIEQPTWISCEERLPAESGYYLVVYRDKFNGSKLVSIDFYTKCTAGEWWDNDFGRTAIYWMPLPEMPKGMNDG